MAKRKHLKDVPVTALPVTTRDLWLKQRLKLELLQKEQLVRHQELEPMFYGAPDLLFPKGFKAGVWDPKSGRVVREPLGYDESDEQYRERQNRAIFDLVVDRLTIVKDDRVIKIRAIPKMAKILADLFYGRVQKLILWANRGGGKCHAAGTKVLLADGRRASVEDVRPGDRLMGPDGKGRNVLVVGQGWGPLFRIVPTKGEPWVCNADHVLTVVRQGRQGRGGEVLDISLKDFLARSKTFQQEHKLFHVGVDQFEPDPTLKPLRVDPYFLGVWFGDGTKTVLDSSRGERLSGVEITKADPEIRDLCVATARDWGLTCHVQPVDNHFRFRLSGQTGSHNMLLEALRNAVGPDVTVPESVLRGPRETRLKFLAGFLDTDGERKFSGFSITQKRYDWARAIWWIARSLGFASHMHQREATDQNGTTGTYWVVSIDGDGETIPTRIPRRRASPRRQRKDHTRTGFTIEPQGDGQYYGFELDQDGRYLLGDFTVTHNSLLAAVYMWVSFVYHKRSSINLGGSGNQARRVYDYTKQFWHSFPGMHEGMLSREPLLQQTELKNGSRMVCATSVTTAIGEHIPNFTADEASILPGTLIDTDSGPASIEEIRSGQLVRTTGGVFRPVKRAFSHPYAGRVLKIVPYGSSLSCWVTDEHRIWAVRGGELCWVRARDLSAADHLAYPRVSSQSVSFREVLEDGRVFEGPDFWRFLGYWCGDGSAANVRCREGRGRNYPVKLHLSEAKRYFVDDALVLLRRFTTGSVFASTPPSRPNSIDLVSSSDKVLSAWFRGSVGLGDQRRVPWSWLERASDVELREFLVGIFRTDGSRIIKNNVLKGLSWSSVSPGLAQAVLYALNRLGLSSSLSFRSVWRYDVRTKDVWAILLNAPNVMRVLPVGDLGGAQLPRSCAPRSGFTETYGWCRIKSIESDDYTGPVYDLEVEDGASFATPASIMLHNCTDRPGADNDLARAMQGSMSELNHSIFLLSTFHLPTGFFADIWDSSEQLGFTSVMWNCFESMERCTDGLELATPEDPKAIESFCKKSCPLSWQEPTSDVFGNVTGSEWVGCCGQARTSEGWHTREQVIDGQRVNKGTRIFEVEHMCRRPQREGQIYNRALIDGCLIDTFNLNQDVPRVIGLDWGLTQCALVLIGEWIEDNPDDSEFPIEGIGVVDVAYMSNRLVDAVVDQIQRWQQQYGDAVVIRADGSHPYNNRELAVHGYEVKPVRGDPKQMGKDNTARWIGSGSFKILRGFELFVSQLHNLRQNALTGKQVKQNRSDEEGDHGPDALRFALMEYDYVKWSERRKKLYRDLLDGRSRHPADSRALRRRTIDGQLG